MTGKGHNGPPRGVDVTAEQIASFVARIERLNADEADELLRVYEDAILRAGLAHAHEAP
jgi:hypothetical protein